jgi:hypothetical protein
MSHSAFSVDYADARARFRQAASAIQGVSIDVVTHPERGPAGESLTTEVAWIGPANAERVLVTASGTHGIEGFCGSAAQVEWLHRHQSEKAALPTATAVMLVHAVNPYGFAWRRRVTHENVDLNRNWLGFSTAAHRNLEYEEIADVLCPPEWTDETRGRTLQQLLSYAREHGMNKFVQVVSGGQHRHPDGLFYGGTSATAAREALTSILREHLSKARQVAIIDFHSGLGPPGIGEIIAAALADTPAFSRARTWYGKSVQPIGSQGDDFAKVSGDWLTAVPDLLSQATVTAVAIEFGTVPALQVLDALRADNWLHTRSTPGDGRAEGIRAQMTSAFYIDDDVWRGMVLGQSLLACKQAMAGLLSS